MADLIRYIVIDDDEPSIVYSDSEWFQDLRWNGFGFNGNPYQGSQHGTNGTGKVTFSYEGQGYIVVYGTVPVQNSTTPTWTCSVDGTRIDNLEGPEGSTENNWYMCHGFVPMAGSHTFEMDVTLPSNATFPFYLDQIVYEPNPSDRHDNVEVWLWGTDPMFHYEGQWDPINSNTIATSQQGALTRLDFVGSSVSAYAYIEAKNTTSGSTGSYSVDGSEPIRFFWTAPTTNGSSYGGQLLFTTPELDVGPHSLTMTYLSDGVETAPLSLNFILIHNGSFPVMTNVPDSPVPPQSTLAGTNATGGSLGRSGTIVTAVIIPVVVVAMVCCFLLWRWRRRNSSLKSNAMVYTPFTVPSNPTSPDSPQMQQNMHHPREKLRLGRPDGIVQMSVTRAASGSNSPGSSDPLLTPRAISPGQTNPVSFQHFSGHVSQPPPPIPVAGSSNQALQPVASGSSYPVRASQSPSTSSSDGQVHQGQILPSPQTTASMHTYPSPGGQVEPARQLDSGIRFSHSDNGLLPPFYTPV